MKEERIWCKELVVVDENDKPRIMLTASSKKSSISICGDKGAIIIGTFLDHSMFCIYDKKGKPKVLIMLDDEDIRFYPIDKEQKDMHKELDHRLAKMHGEFVEELFRKGRS